MPFYIGIETVGNNFATLASPGEDEPKNKLSIFTNSQANQAEASLRLLASPDGTVANSVVLCGPKRVLGMPIQGLHEPRLDMILNVGDDGLMSLVYRAYMAEAQTLCSVDSSVW